ncbi:unnamed protein product, partial [Medioppia subpectinata]
MVVRVPARQCSTPSSGGYHCIPETRVPLMSDQFCTHERRSLSAATADVVRHILFSNMLCCGRKKGSRDVRGQQILGEGSASAYGGLAHHHHHQQPVNALHFRKGQSNGGKSAGETMLYSIECSAHMNADPYPPPPPTLSVLREKVRHILFSNMLCCGRKKGSRDVRGQQILGEGSASAYGGLAHHHHHQQPVNALHFRKGGPLAGPYHSQQLPLRSRMPEMVVQSDFRKVSGITSEVFRQIEAVENDFDSTTAAYFESVEKRGEMVIRLLNPQTLGRAGVEAGRRYGTATTQGGGHHSSAQFVEIIKRPGQTLGLYIREGDGYRCSDGVFISRIALESAVYNSGLLKVGDEVLAVNLVDVRRMSLDDVVIIMSIPRRLVLTIRSHIYSGSQSAIMARKSMGNDYRNLPVVVVKREVEDEPYDEGTSQRDSENGHLMQARLKGLPDNIPAMAVPLDGQIYRALPPRPEDEVIYYNTQPLQLRTSMSGTYPSMQVRDDMWSDQRTGVSHSRPYGIITQQPNVLRRQYPRTIDNLSAQVHQYYSSGYSSDVPQSSRRSGSMGVTRAAVHRPPSTGRQRYWEDYAMAGSAPNSGHFRGQRLLRTESDHGIPPTMSDDFLDRYMRPLSRTSVSTTGGYPSVASMQDLKQRRIDELRNSSSNQAINSILRRRNPYFDGSASDTETSSPSHYLLGQRSLGSYSRMVRGGGGSRDSFQLRSSSLPRTRPQSQDYPYFSRTPPSRRPPRQTVRFERPPLGYDEDSDGAVSAPELPATRPRRMGRRTTSPNTTYSSDEYQNWMVRAPSTSAIYECVRRGKQLPLSSHSINKIANSAESLLDTIRSEQKRTLLADLYASRAAITGKTSSMLPMGREDSNRALNKSILNPFTMDYLRGSIPNPTPVKPSEDSRLHLLSLNPREFFKYRPEKPERGLQSEGFSGLVNVHLLAGRGLRASTGHVSEHYRDVYCVLECDRIHKARTVVRSGEQSFDWDEVFDVDLFDTKEIAFLLYTWDPQFRHKLCYKGVLHLSSLSLNETPAHSLALKMEPRGTLYVKLRYKDLQSTFQRPIVTPSGQTVNAIFGVDVESVVNRENSGLNVPLIVKRCVDEIEKRGLDLVGIYRLCGSSVRKKMLREGFEKNAWLCDLSPEHVPDINVIASDVFVRHCDKFYLTKLCTTGPMSSTQFL